jgi:hypothetical protein
MRHAVSITKFGEEQARYRRQTDEFTKNMQCQTEGFDIQLTAEMRGGEDLLTMRATRPVHTNPPMASPHREATIVGRMKDKNMARGTGPINSDVYQ